MLSVDIVGLRRQAGAGKIIVLQTKYCSPNVARRSATTTQCQLQLPRSVHEVTITPQVPTPTNPPPAPSAGTHAPAGPSAVPQLWEQLAAQHGERLALMDPHAQPASEYTYADVARLSKQLAAGLASLGVQKGDVVALFSEGSSRWVLLDQAVMLCGAANAVRGTSSPLDELSYILTSSKSSGVIVQDAATLDKLLPVLHSGVSFAVLLHGIPSPDAVGHMAGRTLLSFDQLLGRGAPLAAAFTPPPLSSDDLATLIYTSGTSGHPKAVMLTHGNLMYQIRNFQYFLPVVPGQRTLSVLPPWHAYERSCTYYILSCGATQVYTNVRKFREDLQAYPPDFFVCVPLVLDTLYSKVMATLKKASTVRRMLATNLLAAAAMYVRAQRVVDGLSLEYALHPRPLVALVAAWLRCRLLAPLYWLAQVLVVKKVRAAIGIRQGVVSGGGSLAEHLDLFYESIGLPVLNGWGLTETSPVLACRRMVHNVRGTVGLQMPGTQLRIVDPETLQDVPDGQQGLILGKGPGVMRGYFGDEASTANAFMAGDGWFSTGDLGWRAPLGVPGSHMGGNIVLTGRAKDTIVLSSGENVSPQPVEDALCCSPYIKFAMLLGQGHRALGALITTDPEALADLAASKGVEALGEAEVRQLISSEIRRLLAHRIRWEHVSSFVIVKEPFSVDNGSLTRTMKLRRQTILELYAGDVQKLEAHLR